MFIWAASPTAVRALVFDGAKVRNGEIWRVVTWPIAEIPAIFALISIAFFWSFGQQLEGLFGRGQVLTWISRSR